MPLESEFAKGRGRFRDGCFDVALLEGEGECEFASVEKHPIALGKLRVAPIGLGQFRFLLDPVRFLPSV